MTGNLKIKRREEEGLGVGKADGLDVAEVWVEQKQGKQRQTEGPG